MSGIDHEQISKDFSAKFEKMLQLVAKGRGIEILLRIAHQTYEGLESSDKSYDSMMNSALKMNNPHPKQAIKGLFNDQYELERIELARDISDKLAHGLYQIARKLIDDYNKKYQIQTNLNNESCDGWKMIADGHLVEDDGRKIISIIDELSTSEDNLIIEEFDVFVHNNYDKAAEEIIDDAWNRIANVKKSLPSESMRLHMFRGFKRGKRTYEKNA